MNNREDFNTFENQLQDGLQKAIVHVLENRQEVKQKAERCLKVISEKYSPVLYSQRLELLYNGQVSELERL